MIHHVIARLISSTITSGMSATIRRRFGRAGGDVERLQVVHAVAFTGAAAAWLARRFSHSVPSASMMRPAMLPMPGAAKASVPK